MKQLENRTLASKREMDELEALEAIKEKSQRLKRLEGDQVLELYQNKVHQSLASIQDLIQQEEDRQVNDFFHQQAKLHNRQTPSINPPDPAISSTSKPPHSLDQSTINPTMTNTANTSKTGNISNANASMGQLESSLENASESKSVSPEESNSVTSSVVIIHRLEKESGLASEDEDKQLGALLVQQKKYQQDRTERERSQSKCHDSFQPKSSPWMLTIKPKKKKDKKKETFDECN